MSSETAETDIEWSIEINKQLPVVMLELSSEAVWFTRPLEIREVYEDGANLLLLTSHDEFIYDPDGQTLTISLDHSSLRLRLPDKCAGQLVEALDILTQHS